MPGLKRHDPGIRFSNILVRPDEMDMYYQYVILHPAAGSNYFGSAVGTPAGDITILANRADYPRNLLVAQTAGTTGGSIVVNGKDQFGSVITETIAVAAGTSATVAARFGTGVKVFAWVGTATWTPVGSASGGTVALGGALGTSATSPMFGLPVKLGGTSDIKSITWIDGTACLAKQHDAAAAANTTYHAFKGTVAVEDIDSYVVLVRSTYNKEEEETISNL